MKSDDKDYAGLALAIIAVIMVYSVGIVAGGFLAFSFGVLLRMVYDYVN